MFTFIRIVFSILLPPLGVFLKVGIGGHFWLNILLTLFGYVPGLVHAVWVLSRSTRGVRYVQVVRQSQPSFT